MLSTETPPARTSELHDVPVLIVQLQDDLSRSRLREAFWISLVAHLVLLIALLTSPRWISFARPVRVLTAEDLIRNKQLTYLELPPDRQKVAKPPDTNIISDKNRIATRRHPVLDRKTLRELRDVSPPGPPGSSAPPVPPQHAPTPPRVAQSVPPAHPAPSGAGVPPAPTTEARLRPPLSVGNPFSLPASPGSAIEQAARAAAGARGKVGSGGDYGLGQTTNQGVQGDVDILSDTMGVDFGPYLARIKHDISTNWLNLVPEVARAPLMKRGKVVIEFAILKDGKVAGMRLTGPSGDVSLDRAAWGGIAASNPFPPLPSEFGGKYLALRCYFYYNPDRNDMR